MSEKEEWVQIQVSTLNAGLVRVAALEAKVGDLRAALTEIKKRHHRERDGDGMDIADRNSRGLH